MTKHVSGKPRTRRFVMLLSEEEHAAIVDFRFAHRIATEAETVRRLVADGLRMHASLHPAFGVSFSREKTEQMLRAIAADMQDIPS